MFMMAATVCQRNLSKHRLSSMHFFQTQFGNRLQLFCAAVIAGVALLLPATPAQAAVVEFNSTGGTSATNGLHFYIEDTTKMQVRRLNNTGQVYSSGAIPPSTNLDNGVFIRANGTVYGPSHTVSSFNPPMYSSYSITSTSPVNPSSSGIQQVATNKFGISAGPQVSIVWKYTTPLDFLTADVTLTIPAGYAVSAANPVRYLHAFDTYLGGSDNGCGVKYLDANNKIVVGTYKPTGTSCPLSNALPVGVTLVESFRERSGKSFSSYCANTWSTFWSGSSCSVLQSAALGNIITTSYIDTGIAVAFDFVAPGTYTFSYDFVIGSTVVPAYDHIELVHDGSSTLCPENIKILACTSSGVPCNPLDIVNSGVITGNLTVSPATPAVTLTPSSFSIGGTSYTPTVVLQGSGAGTYTLGANNISGTPPLNGIKCWNGTSASCTLVISNTPCVADFECMDTTQTTYNNLKTTPSLRNPLLTKLAATDFKFDVVALQSSGDVATGYTGSVTVDLFDATAKPAPFCAFTGTPVATKTLTFAAANNGRKTLDSMINLSKAYPNLRCQVRQTTPSAVTGCSSDAFSVRPSAVTLLASTLADLAMASGPSASAATTIKAGTGFKMSASTAPNDGYASALTLDTAKLSAQLTTQDSTKASGGVVGTLNPAILTANAAGISNAYYTEVGYLYLAPGAYRDDAFSAVDSATGDCITSAAVASSSTPDDYLSDALIGGKYGCSIGNRASLSFGRFIPDHFSLASASLTAGCPAGGFTYMDDTHLDLKASIEAHNLAGVKTANYSGKFANGQVTYQIENANNGVAIAPSRLAVTATGWGSAANAGAYPFFATQFKRHTVADGPYDQLAIGLSATDEAGQVLLVDRDMEASNTSCTKDDAGKTNGNCTAKTIATTKLRYGRLKLTSVHGSELLPLSLPMKLEYWSGANSGWASNSLDSCTLINASNFSLNFPTNGSAKKPNNLAACETKIAVSGSPPFQKLQLSAPGAGNNGWTDVSVNLSAASGNQCVQGVPTGTAATNANYPWLQFHWTGAGTTQQNPGARATFGVYKNANEFIYLRELY